MPPSDLPSTLDAIDDLTAPACGWCQNRLTGRGPSLDFCGQSCQESWQALQGHRLVDYREPDDLPCHVFNQPVRSHPAVTPLPDPISRVDWWRRGRGVGPLATRVSHAATEDSVTVEILERTPELVQQGGRHIRVRRDGVTADLYVTDELLERLSSAGVDQICRQLIATLRNGSSLSAALRHAVEVVAPDARMHLARFDHRRRIVVGADPAGDAVVIAWRDPAEPRQVFVEPLATRVGSGPGPGPRPEGSRRLVEHLTAAVAGLSEVFRGDALREAIDRAQALIEAARRQRADELSQPAAVSTAEIMRHALERRQQRNTGPTHHQHPRAPRRISPRRNR